MGNVRIIKDSFEHDPINADRWGSSTLKVQVGDAFVEEWEGWDGFWGESEHKYSLWGVELTVSYRKKVVSGRTSVRLRLPDGQEVLWDSVSRNVSVLPPE